MNRVVLGLFRGQPVQKGHTAQVNSACEDFSTVIVGIGSPHKSREPNNPWTVEERMQMWKNVYGDRIRLIPFADMGFVNPADWCEYVLNKIRGAGLPEPTDYMTGSVADALWYREHFYLEGEQTKRHLTSDGMLRKLRIMNRENIASGISATEIRQYLQMGSDKWRQYVPAVNHDLVFDNYPDEFKVPEARRVS